MYIAISLSLGFRENIFEFLMASSFVYVWILFLSLFHVVRKVYFFPVFIIVFVFIIMPFLKHIHGPIPFSYCVIFMEFSCLFIRAIFAACGMYYLTGVTPEDTLYDPLPMYHTVGGIIGPGMCLVQGTSVAIRRKFSASNYWKDCIKYNCTVCLLILTLVSN